MALKIDWSFLDRHYSRKREGDGFTLYDYSHPAFIRYVAGNSQLSLCYDFVNDPKSQHRRWLLFKVATIQIDIPSALTWDNGTPLTPSEAAVVLPRICGRLTEYWKKPSKVVINDKIYERLADIERRIEEENRAATKSNSPIAANR